MDEILKGSSDHTAMIGYWDLTDTIVSGSNAIKAGGETYMPRLPQEQNKAYDFRLSLGKFTNIYRDILEGLASKPFQEEIDLINNNDKTITKFLENVDGSGNNLTVFSFDTFFNGINSAIDWIFIDYADAPSDGTVRTQADEQALGIRPFWSHVLARNVLEVRSEIVAGQEKLSYIRIFEPGHVNQVRIMKMFDVGVAGFEIWVEKTKKNGFKEYILERSGPITIGEIPMVPFVTGRRNGKSWRFYPAMRDAADLQINLYRNESNLEYAMTMTAFPIFIAEGVKPDVDANGIPKAVSIGPNAVLYAPPKADGSNGTWKIIEATASSLTFLQSNIEKTIQQLRELGRQPLTAQSGNLTVITTAVAAGKAKSAVAAWSLGLKDALENALRITAKWYKIEIEPEVKVWSDFDDFADGAADLQALLTMRATGDISQETFWAEMRRRRVLSSDFDKEIEIERLLAEIPGDDFIDETQGTTDDLEN